MTIDWQDFKVRCSAITKITSKSRSNPTLTEAQEQWMKDYEARQKPPTEKQQLEYARLLQLRENGTKIILSDTCIDYLMDEYAWRTARKKPVDKELGMDATEKGKEVQTESLKLIAKVEGVIYTENKDRLYNDFLSGEPDAFLGESLIKATGITDTKNCWDYPGFLKKINTGLDNGYEDQIKGYGDIVGCGNLSVHYCLVNTPEWLIFRYMERLLRSMNVVSAESPEYLEKAAELEASMRFNDIPDHKRVRKIVVDPFTDTERQKVYDRVKICRDWLCEFDEKYQKMNLV
jgi:hypothetical protein